MILINRIKAFTVNVKADIWNQTQCQNSLVFHINIVASDLCMGTLLYSLHFYFTCTERVKKIIHATYIFNSLWRLALAWLKPNIHPTKSTYFQNYVGRRGYNQKEIRVLYQKLSLPTGWLTPTPQLYHWAISHKCRSWGLTSGDLRCNKSWEIYTFLLWYTDTFPSAYVSELLSIF